MFLYTKPWCIVCFQNEQRIRTMISVNIATKRVTGWKLRVNYRIFIYSRPHERGNVVDRGKRRFYETRIGRSRSSAAGPHSNFVLCILKLFFKKFFGKTKKSITGVFGVDLEFRGRRSRVIVAESARFSRRLHPFRQSSSHVREPRERPSTQKRRHSVYARLPGRRPPGATSMLY